MTRDVLLRPKFYQYVLEESKKCKHREPGDLNDITLYLLGDCPSHLTYVDMRTIMWNYNHTLATPQGRIYPTR
jgi:hypothetical protein